MKRQALVVGINQYPFGDNLTTPATAAEKVSQLLEKYGDFEVHRLPSQEGVRQVRQFIEKAKNNPDSVTFYGNSDYELPNEFKDGFVYIIHGATWQGVYILKKGLPDYPSRKAELNEIDEKIAEHYIKSGKAIKLIWNLSHNSFVNYRKNTEVIFRDGTGCLRTTCWTAPFLSNAEISRILYSEQAIVKKDR